MNSCYATYDNLGTIDPLRWVLRSPLTVLRITFDEIANVLIKPARSISKFCWHTYDTPLC